MTIIAIETSSLTAGVAIVDETTVLMESSLQVGKIYAESLPVMLERGIRETHISMDQVDGVAVSIGPGSYTGLRVGLSLAKGLAYSLDKPLLAVPTLDAIAVRIPYSNHPVQALLDARKQKVYTAVYDTSSGTPERLTDYSIATILELTENISTPTVFLGPAAVVYRKEISAVLGELALFPEMGSTPCASSVAFIGRSLLEDGMTASLYEQEPMYLRKPAFKRHESSTVGGAGSPDAGSPDAGSPDAGSPDAGSPDR